MSNLPKISQTAANQREIDRQGNGKFGFKTLKTNDFSDPLPKPPTEEDMAAMRAVFASDPDAMSRPHYDPAIDVASVGVMNVFGVQGRVIHNYATGKQLGIIPADARTFEGAQVDEFMDGLTTGEDGVERTVTEAFERFKELATGLPQTQADAAEPATTVEPERTSGYKLSPEESRWMTAEEIRDIESGAIPCGDDERIASGEVFDRVYDVEDGTLWHRAQAGKSYPVSDVYGMRLQTPRALSEDEQSHLAGLVGYAWSMGGRGEGCSLPYSTGTDNAFVIGADSTKSRGDAPGKVVEMLETFMAEGTPARKTKGMTRLVEAFPDQSVKAELYFDCRVENL